MKVMFTLEFSDDERMAIANERGETELVSRDSVQNWVRKKIEAILCVMVRDHQAKYGLKDDNEIQVADLHIERWRSTGSVADDANAVRILHLPSQNVVISSECVSFHENRKLAMEKLRARLADERAGICPICHFPVNSGPCQRNHP